MRKQNEEQSIALAGAIIGRSGRILLVKKPVEGGKTSRWGHPDSTLAIGEHPLAAASRAVTDATGFAFEPSGLLGIYSLALESSVSQQYVKVMYKGKLLHVTGGPDDETPMEIHWFSPKEIYGLAEDELADPDIKAMVRDYFAGRGGDLDLIKHTTA